ncbi:MAG: hypothetical protein ACOCP8_07120, partial [archaeon]
MKKSIIKKFVKQHDDVVEKAKKIKEDFDNEKIRIRTDYIQNTQGSNEHFFYNPLSDKVSDGIVMMSNGMKFHLKNIGDIEIIIEYQNYDDYDFISINRIVRFWDETAEYDDMYECKFKQNHSENEYALFREKRDKLIDRRFAYIVECIECGEKELSIKETEYNREIVENGEG